MAEESKVSVQLTVNGQEVSLNEFVQQITMNILTGIVKSLKIDDELKTAVFELKIE
jgi:hypothetical protein